jgi:pimeloyl-ACP methyl ester carboxylesterase
MPAEWITSVFESAQGIDWPATLKAITRPVLLCVGAYDFVAPPTAWTDEHLPPQATVVLFDMSAHTPYFEEPDAFMNAVAPWVATL